MYKQCGLVFRWCDDVQRVRRRSNFKCHNDNVHLAILDVLQSHEWPVDSSWHVFVRLMHNRSGIVQEFWLHEHKVLYDGRMQHGTDNRHESPSHFRIGSNLFYCLM